jgi:hypothetical protein
LISAFHPSVILCTTESWANEDYQNRFLKNLIDHVDKIKELGIKIAWSDDIESILWNDPPWRNFYAENVLIETFHEIISNSCMYHPPPENECNMIPLLTIDFSSEVKIYWSVLIHRLMHKQKKAFIVTNLKIKETTSINVSCNCEPTCCENIYQIINDPTEWYKKIDYIRLCPKSLNNWDKSFLLALRICYEQKFNQRTLKNKIENLKFSNSFKRTFVNISDEGTKEKIIETIVQRLTYTNAEAGCHSGLRDEKIKGKENEYSFRVSKVERIHYSREEGRMCLLNYHPGSEHDIRCK